MTQYEEIICLVKTLSGVM